MNLNVDFPRGLHFFREEAPLGEHVFRRLLLGKEQRDAAHSAEADSEDQVDHDEHPLDEQAFFVQVAYFHLGGRVLAQVGAAADLACVTPPPNVHEDEKDDGEAHVNRVEHVGNVLQVNALVPNGHVAQPRPNHVDHGNPEAKANGQLELLGHVDSLRG